MQHDAPPIGRRERNKQQKLERITAAATELFSEHGVDEVTTQQIADRADVGAGTVFLYAKSKAELLLLVHNVKFADAIETGVAAASAALMPSSRRSTSTNAASTRRLRASPSRWWGSSGSPKTSSRR